MFPAAKPSVKGIAALLLVLLSALGFGAIVSVTAAQTTDAYGNASEIKLGEPFYLTAKLSVDGELSGTYAIRFALPYQTRSTPALRFTGEPRVTWGPFTPLMDGPIPVTVSIASATDLAGTALTISLIPVAPTKGVEYFAPQALSGSVGGSATLSYGTASGLKWFAPIPTTGGFQQVLATSKHGTLATSTPFAQPVVVDPKVIGTDVQFQTLASSVRCNSTLLRQAAWSAYSSLPTSISVWLRSETLVQAKSTDVTAFVGHSLPSGYRTTMKPYDAAQRLFKAVVAKLQYFDTTARPDAVVALRTGQGSCAHFCSVFVAACRNIGIPARAVCGMAMGESAWHVWAEFWVPGQGWVPVDPTYSDGLCPDGSLALYFGVIPELNERVATTYGFDHVVSGVSIPMLQSPAVWVSSGTKVAAIDSRCSVAVASSN